MGRITRRYALQPGTAKNSLARTLIRTFFHNKPSPNTAPRNTTPNKPALFLAFLCLAAFPAAAQETSGSFTGGSVMIGYDNRSCTVGLESAIRYTAATDLWEFCNGTAWTNLSSGGVSSITDLTDAFTDYTTEENMIIGRAGATALFAGAQFNLFIGEGAGATTANSTATTDNNIAIGYLALTANTTGYQNTGVGVNALATNTIIQGSTAIGFSAMRYYLGPPGGGPSYSTAVGNEALVGDSITPTNNFGDYITAVGHRALFGNTSGRYNVGLGSQALYTNTTGGTNTGVGHRALFTSNGFDNTALGMAALELNSGGSGSTAVGSAALRGLTTGGTQNTALGFQAGNSITTGDLNIMIGYDVDASAIGVNSELNIGNTIYGDMANDRIRIGGAGAVTAGPFIATPPAAQAIAAAGTIAADACGTVKALTSAADVTTSVTDTFTAPSAALNGCCMDVVNTDATNNITLDANATFKTIGGANQTLGPYDAVRVCSNGALWFQMSAIAGNQ